MIKKFFTVLLLLNSIHFTIFSQTKNQKEITVPELYDHILFLASDDLKGRKPGTNGGRLAAEYIRDQIKQSGFTAVG